MPTFLTRLVLILPAVLACGHGFGKETPAKRGDAGLGKHPGLVAQQPAKGPFVKIPDGFPLKGYMVSYTATIPGTKVSYTMVPIPGGRFTMGSPKDEPGRRADEGPQFEVELRPFWMAKCEVSWAEYQTFMELYSTFKDFERLRNVLAPMPEFDIQGKTPEQIAGMKAMAAKHAVARADLQKTLASADRDTLRTRLSKRPVEIDAITSPTPLYDPEMTYEFGGEPEQPAVTMTQYAAKQYTKWLSLLSGTFYRLPSEAEWEYACRAGSKTAYHFGDKVDDLDKFAWYTDNSDDETHPVGSKAPNAFGLHDMHGSVAEWVLDAHSESGYVKREKTVVGNDSVVWPTEVFSRVVRGGSWDDEASDLRSAARLASEDEDWKDSDPNIPLSPWWFTEDPTRGIGFRFVEPLDAPDVKQRAKFWEADHEDIRLDVAERLREGRGVRDSVDTGLPGAIEQLKGMPKEE